MEFHTTESYWDDRTRYDDFLDDDNDSDYLLNDESARCLTDSNLEGRLGVISNIEIMKDVVEDILLFTMWELVFKDIIRLDYDELFKFVKDEDNKQKLIEIIIEMSEMEYGAYIFVKQGKYSIKLNINNNYLQEAMDFCENWYYDYEIPDNYFIREY